MGLKVYDDTGLLKTTAGGSGETNTATNVGTDGVSIVDGKIGSDLQFRAPATTDDEMLSIVLDAGDNDIDFTILGAPTIQQNMLKNTPGTITVGQVVYAAGYSTVVEVELADADNASLMPAIGMAAESITDLAAGKVVSFGLVTANTTGKGVGDAVYVDTTPGAWTTTRPTGTTAAIQKIGWVAEVGASGKIFVVGAGRSNDVPNLQDAYLWVGNASNVATPVQVSLDATMANTGALTIAADAVTYAKMQNVVANNVLLGNNAGAGQPVDELTGTEATALLDVFTPTLKGLAPLSGGGTLNFLRADGTWAVPPGSGGAPHAILDGSTHSDSVAQAVSRGSMIYGNATPAWDELVVGAGVLHADGTDVTGWSAIVTNDITDDNVTYQKIQNVVADNVFLGNNSGAGSIVDELTGTEATALLDDFVGDSGAGGTKGLVPAPGAGDAAAGKYLDADGTWTVPPGGGTHTLLDNTTHTDTVTQAVTRGSMVYGNATPAWDELVVGTGVLHADGTDVSGWSLIVTTDVTANNITNSLLAQMAANTVKANATAGLADPADLAVGTNTVVGRVAGNIVAAQLVTGQIADDNVTYAKIQNVVANNVFLGNNAGAGGIVDELTGTEATALLDDFVGDSGAGGTKGLVPAPGAGDAAAGKYLDADGTWTVPPGGGAHNLLDNGTHTDTVTQTVSRGSLVYGNATPAWDELTVGGAGTYLQADGTDVAWGALDISQDTSPTLGGSLNTAGNSITYAGDQTIDLTGAATRTLTIQNSTSSQVCDVDIDGQLKLRDGTGFTLTFNPTLSASNRTITFPDATDTVAVLGLVTTQTFTGPVSFSGAVNMQAGTLRLPGNNALASEGEVTVDDTDDQLVYYSSSAERVLVPEFTWAHPFLEPASGTEATTHYTTSYGVTGITVKSVCRGTTPSVAWELRTNSDRSAAGTLLASGTTTSTTTVETDTFTAAVATGQFIWVELDTVTGTVDEFWIQIEYKYTRT